MILNLEVLQSVFSVLFHITPNFANKTQTLLRQAKAVIFPFFFPLVLSIENHLGNVKEKLISHCHQTRHLHSINIIPNFSQF